MSGRKHTPAPFTRLITTHSSPSSSQCCSSQASSSSSSPEPVPGPAVSYHPRSGPGPFQQVYPGTFFSLVYTADPRPTLDGSDSDVTAHEERHDSGTVGLTWNGGNVCRVVEWAPNPTASSNCSEENEASREAGGEEKDGDKKEFMHRTESLDYGIVLFGEVDLLVPSQPPRRLKAGDICVQRGTMHAWRNASATEPARMVFVLVKAEVKGPEGEEVKEYLPPLDRMIAQKVGVPEGVDATEGLLKARRV